MNQLYLRREEKHHAFADVPDAMPSSLQVFIVIFVIGVLLRSRAVLTKTHAERLATFVFSVSLPATILVSLDQVPLAPTAWKLPLAVVALSICLAVVMLPWLPRLAAMLLG